VDHRYKNPYRDDLQRVKDLKTRFDALKKELQDIHGDWLKLHDSHSEASHEHRQSHNELISREIQVYTEVQQLLNSVVGVIGRAERF